MKSWSWPCMTTDSDNKGTSSNQLMAKPLNPQIKRREKFSFRQNYASIFGNYVVLSFVFGLLSIHCSNCFSLSTKDASDIIKYFPYNNERINNPSYLNKRSGAVNFFIY